MQQEQSMIIAEKSLMGRDRYVARVDEQGRLTLIESVGSEQVVVYLPAKAVCALANLLRRQVVRETIGARK